MTAYELTQPDSQTVKKMIVSVPQIFDPDLVSPPLLDYIERVIGVRDGVKKKKTAPFPM